MEFLSEALRIAQVILGIGLVIFVHEGGHFIAARLMGVRVVTFSLGFGPRLFGWRRGGTQYQIAAVPLGGFCRMAGEDRVGDDTPPLPDELNAKSVGARFFIYSGGVLMNLVFALLVFPILFHIGMPFLSPVIGPPMPGTPAWHARVPEGSRVLTVNGRRIISFEHIASAVALGDPEEAFFLLEVPGESAPREIRLEPEIHPKNGFSTVGLRPAAARNAEGHLLVQVPENSPAWEVGMRTDDLITDIVGGIRELPLIQRINAALVAGEPLQVSFTDRDSQLHEVLITPEPITEEVSPRIGIRPPLNMVSGLRLGAAFEVLDLQVGDRIELVNGRNVRRSGDLVRALLAGADAGQPVSFELMRGSTRLASTGPVMDRASAVALSKDIALGLDLDSASVLPVPGQPAFAAGMRDGDIILEVDGAKVSGWEDVSKLIGSAGKEGRAAHISVSRSATHADDASIEKFAVTAAVLPFYDYGFQLRNDEFIYRADGLLGAIETGAFCSMKVLEDTWLALKRVLLGHVDASVAVGGPIQIGRLSYYFAEKGIITLFFFLCIISVNLAFINVLPIPVLDGGHLFFLIIEKIKGSPVSERVFGYSQLVGVVLLLSLMVFVTYNDLVRWLDPQ